MSKRDIGMACFKDRKMGMTDYWRLEVRHECNVKLNEIHINGKDGDV